MQRAGYCRKCVNTIRHSFAKLYHLRYTVDMEEKDKKITNEKPVSLYPLDFKEALAAFLQVKPKPKEEMDKAIKQKKTKEKKTSD